MADAIVVDQSRTTAETPTENRLERMCFQSDRIPAGYRIDSPQALGGLHHEYSLEMEAA
jgi:hypothetical protein